MKKISVIIIFLLVILTSFLFSSCGNENKYNDAITFYEEGKYEEAIKTFEELGDYKDSKEQIERCRAELELAEKIKNISSTNIGGSFMLGKYEQDNDITNGKENIEWIVLTKEGDRIFAISKYALDSQRYNTTKTTVTWETCSLRKWLNDTFLNDAFNEREQDIIIETNVTADANPDKRCYGVQGKDTIDKVFLISMLEAETYFKSDNARRCQLTEYASSRTSVNYSNGFTYWWLRTMGFANDLAANVLDDGELYISLGGQVENVEGVRPAIWINLGEK